MEGGNLIQYAQRSLWRVGFDDALGKSGDKEVEREEGSVPAQRHSDWGRSARGEAAAQAGGGVGVVGVVERRTVLWPSSGAMDR